METVTAYTNSRQTFTAQVKEVGTKFPPHPIRYLQIVATRIEKMIFIQWSDTGFISDIPGQA